ncbi:MAG TPA: PEP-CTERM sorting domain-containing protein [Verrucomicrobiae bacterium]|nr:PEP-CTERM sorting domain-containing protein [Verrucomicrobiae bacterium]
MIATVLVVAMVFAVSVRGQGFINLNFESAYNLPSNPPPPNGTYVPVSNALPGWAAFDGPNAYSDIYYVSNFFYGAGTAVELASGSVALNGTFSVGLYGGGSISQTGLVPNSDESLQFEASSTLNLEVTLGGQNLSYSALSKGPGYTLYGANIPGSLVGQVEELEFIGGSDIVLDNIQFSPMSIPEPGESGLIGVGAVLFGVCRRRKDAWPRKNT